MVTPDDLLRFSERWHRCYITPGSTKTPNTSDAEFNHLAVDLFQLQFGLNPPYRRFCESLRVQPPLESWIQIPAVPTSGFKELELSCIPETARTHVFHSSGTTAHTPSRHFHHGASLQIYEASLWAWFSRHLLSRPLDPPPRLLILAPTPAQAPHSSLVHMFETVRARVGAPESAFLFSADDEGGWCLQEQLAVEAFEVESDAPMLVLGTAFTFVHLLDHLRRIGRQFRLPPGSAVMETGGYKGRSRSLPKPELHALISSILGIARANIICEYGMSELSSQAYDAHAQPEHPVPSQRVFRFPPWVRAQLISPESGREVAEGETGLIRVYDLANIYSCLAVQTEDLGIRHGDGFELLGRAQNAEPRGCSLQAPN